MIVVKRGGLGFVPPNLLLWQLVALPISCSGGLLLRAALLGERSSPVQALNEWVRRMAPDLPGTILVLLHVAEKLQRLHAEGLCHRDLKPANILWQPSANAWTLMDFGCAATIGALL